MTPLDDFSLDNHLRPYLYQTHAGQFNVYLPVLQLTELAIDIYIFRMYVHKAIT